MQIRTEDKSAIEISWFAPICNGDTDFLGQMPDHYKSTWKNTSNIVLHADRLGYQNVLCPSSYQVGQDTWTFASGLVPLTKQINLLPAIRCGEQHPIMLARSIATLDHMADGRLTLNVISSNMPGEDMSSQDRYQRSREVIEILKQGWSQPEINYKGSFYSYQLPTDPVKPYQSEGPLLYFGGYSPAGVDLCAAHCDVYLMWPETLDRLTTLMQSMGSKAAEYGRKVDFGLRIHMIVRETEAEAIEWSQRLVSRLDDQVGTEIRERALDAKSLGVARQSEMRDLADRDGFIEDQLWTGIGRARSGCGAALVGNPDQILQKIQQYIDLGIRSFIFSGYPHLAEAEHFARWVLPSLPKAKLNVVQKKIPDGIPNTPLGTARRR